MTFVPFRPDKRHAQSARVGWITDAMGCDIWQGCRNSAGYAMVRFEGRAQLVYRVRYEREVGPIPVGLDLDHYVCDRGAEGCCNPHHCRPASRRENTLRGTAPVSDNASKTHCHKGHPLSGDNLVKCQLKLGHRECAECKRERDRADHAKHRDARLARMRAYHQRRRA